MTAEGLTGSGSIEIAAPPDVVFAYQTDPALVVKWLPGLIEASAYGEIAPGATARAAYEIKGRVFEGTSRILDVQPPRLIVTEDIVRNRTMTQRVEIVGTREGKSRVEVEVKHPQLGLLGRAIVRGRGAGLLSKQVEFSLARLKSAIETPGEPLPDQRRARPRKR